ncbi:MAG: hypothetical protein AAF125_13160 [Chloroflexota bacterium]
MAEYDGREAVSVDDFTLSIVAVIAITIGVTLFLFSLAYLRDLETLRNAPDAIWDAMCGRPDPEALTLPLLLAGSVIGVGVGGSIHGWRWLRRQGDDV